MRTFHWLLVGLPGAAALQSTAQADTFPNRPVRLIVPTGTGGGVHLSIEMLRGLTGMNVAHIPYKSTAAAVTDVIENQVPFTVTGLPTISESVPGYAFDNWIGILAPAKTSPDLIQKMKVQGDVPATNSAAEFSAMVKKEIATCSALVKSTGAHID